MRALEQIEGRLRSAGVYFELIEHAAVFTMADVDRELRIPGNARVKTVAVSRRGGAPLLCGIHAGARLDFKAVAAASCSSHSQLGLMPAESVEGELGVQPGAVGLVTPRRVRIFLDGGFEQLGHLYCGSGDHGKTLKVDRASLVNAFGIISIGMER